MITVDERIERAKQSAAAEARRAGQSEAEVWAAVDRAEKLHSDPRTQAIYTRMEREGAARIEAERLEAVQRYNQQEREFAEDLDRHYQDRLNFYRLRGVPQAEFDKEVWPEIRRAFVAGEADAVEFERMAGSDSIF